MLSDLERKILRILYNFTTQRHRMPTMPELLQKTGRNREDISAGLRVLVEQHYILWPDNPRLDTIVILEAWERDQPLKHSKSSSASSNIYYWTKH
ncbi:hypothetical protein [Paenibacillus timonensis]|uniref:hypothetical protein n=1 Tax=Paenibacillus timonensis TaxID=225915 RepID=UPI003F9E130C